MIDIFSQYALPIDAVLGSTEGKLFYGNQNPIVDDLSSVPVGSYYLRDFECTMHLKYGPNRGDWTILNAGSANRALGAFVRTRHTENIVLTGNTNSPVPFGVFDISTAPNVVRSPNQHSVTMVEGGTYVVQYWFSAIGNPTDLQIELSIDGEVIAQNRDIVTGIAVVDGAVKNSSLAVRAINDTGNIITLQEFHCLVFKIDVPRLLDVTPGGKPVKVEDDVGEIVEVAELEFGSGLLKSVTDGKVNLSVDPSIIPTIPEIPAEKYIVATDGVNLESDLSKITVGDGLTMTKGNAGEITLRADPIDGGGNDTHEHCVFSAYSTYYSSVSWYTRDINWDIETKKDIDCYKHNVGSTEVEILKSGWYKVQYEVSFRISSGSSRSVSRSYIMVNGWKVNGSESYGYHRSSSQGYDAVSATIAVYLAAGDKVKIQTVRKFGNATLYTQPYASRIFIENI